METMPTQGIAPTPYRLDLSVLFEMLIRNNCWRQAGAPREGRGSAGQSQRREPFPKRSVRITMRFVDPRGQNRRPTTSSRDFSGTAALEGGHPDISNHRPAERWISNLLARVMRPTSRTAGAGTRPAIPFRSPLACLGINGATP